MKFNLSLLKIDTHRIKRFCLFMFANVKMRITNILDFVLCTEKQYLFRIIMRFTQSGKTLLGVYYVQLTYLTKIIYFKYLQIK